MVEQQSLANLILQPIRVNILTNHCDMRRTASVDIHSDFDFLPFHRVYIQRLEDDLVLSENPQFVSLQQWDVNFPIGAPFQAIDPSRP